MNPHQIETTLMAAPLPVARVLAEIADERARQEQLMRDGKFSFTCASPLCTGRDKLPVLGEEFGEVCREVCEDQRPHARKRLRTELIQLAAVAAAWAESLTENAECGMRNAERAWATRDCWRCETACDMGVMTCPHCGASNPGGPR